MPTLNETAFGIIAVIYGLVGLSLIMYTDHIRKQLERHEAKQKLELEEHFEHHKLQHDCEDREEVQPLLGVVTPPPTGRRKK